MKKMKNYFLAAMVSFMMLMPALTGTNATYAKSNVTLASTDWVAIGNMIVELIEAIEEAFCPETPQNRCKQGVCGKGACISFRSACGTVESVC
jgi:hypothetical protein